MTFLEFSCYVIPGSLVVAGIVHFVKKAYRRYRYNQERKKYLYTLRHHAELGNLLSLLEMKKHKNWRN